MMRGVQVFLAVGAIFLICGENVLASQPSSYEPFDGEVSAIAAMRANPSPANARTLADLRRSYAVALRNMAQGDRTSPAFQRFLFYAESAAKLDPGNAQNWMIFGAGLLEVPELSATQPLAEEAFRQALVLEPDNADAAMHLGHALFNQQRFDTALAQWQRVLRSHPAAVTPIVLARMNIAAIASGTMEEAVGFYDDLIALSAGSRDLARIMLAQAILAKQLLDDTGQPRWQARLDSLGADLTSSRDVASRLYWGILSKKWQEAAQ